MPWRLIGVGVSLIVLAVALAALQRILRDIEPEDVLAAFSSVGVGDVALCLVFTACSYLTLTCYDALALGHLRLKVPYPRTALASFTSYAFVNNIGLAPLTAGSIRYRIYSVEGLTAPDIVALTAVCTLTFLLGAMAGLGGALVLEGTTLSAVSRLQPSTNQLLGAVILGLLAAYVVWVWFKARIIDLRGYSLTLPGPRLTLAQIAVAVTDLVFAAAALFVLMPESLDIGFPAFAGVFVAAIGLGLISHTPGGVGIFEAAILLAFPDLPPEEVLGRLILFRCLYYLVPLSVAAAMLALHEAVHPAGVARRLADTAVAASSATPQVLGLSVLICGILVLLTSALPVNRPSDQVVHLPWQVMELGWVASGAAGMTLILLTRGLFRRLSRAWFFALAMLAVAGVAVLLRGPDLRIAAVVFVGLFLLLAARRGFARRARLRDQAFPVVWIGIVLASLGVTVWLGNLSHANASGYGLAELLKFGPDSAGGRATRALIVAGAIAAGFAILVRSTARAALAEPAPQIVRQLVRRSEDPEVWRGLATDMQHFTLSNAQAALLYQRRARRWVALGDPLLQHGDEVPVGESDDMRRAAIFAAFRERAESRGGTPVFFDVGATSLQQLEKLGFTAIEVGTRFSIDLRSADKVTALPPASLSRIEFDYAETLSDAALRNEIEQLESHLIDRRGIDNVAPGFIYGTKASAEPTRGSAVVLRRSGQLVGGVRLFAGRTGDALIDRFLLPKGPLTQALPAILDRVISLLSERGLRSLSLGTLPASETARAPYRPLLRQLTAAAGVGFYRHGMHFDDLDALRSFGRGRASTSVPRYAAATNGAILPSTLRDVAWLTLPGQREAIEALGSLERVRKRLRNPRGKGGPKSPKA
ncbi:MAG: phosphatidylglycerol lysyltransferase domain-containing protein [Pseudomonadota bacterium]